MTRAELVEANCRLYRALYEGQGPLCSKPWISVEERSSLGNVKPCCWYKGSLGQIRDQDDVAAIWHGERYHALRTEMSAGELPSGCPQWCPLLAARPQWFQKQEFFDYSPAELAGFDDQFLANRARVMNAVLTGESVMTGSYPLRLHLHPSDVCNLRCVMCYLDLDSGRTRDWYASERLGELMQYLEEIKIFGGEPFFCDTSRALILNPDKPRWTHTSFLTNGMLVTERVIEDLEAVRIGTVDISLDAADASTYERIRLRGNFAKAVAGAKRLVELSRRHRLRKFPVFADFVIQEQNYREVARFLELCAEIGINANFTLVGSNIEATRRSEQNGTEVGLPPRDRSAVLEHLETAVTRAEALDSDFAAQSLQRVYNVVEKATAWP